VRSLPESTVRYNYKVLQKLGIFGKGPRLTNLGKFMLKILENRDCVLRVERGEKMEKNYKKNRGDLVHPQKTR
jgi:hypothetical protein